MLDFDSNHCVLGLRVLSSCRELMYLLPILTSSSYRTSHGNFDGRRKVLKEGILIFLNGTVSNMTDLSEAAKMPKQNARDLIDKDKEKKEDALRKLREEANKKRKH